MGQALRRAFLCGVDHYSGQSYEHRRQWVVDRIRLLSSIFAIDVCAYSVMSNHYHLLLKVCPEQLEDLCEDDIMDRWCALFKGPLLIQNYRSSEDLKPFERLAVSDIVNVWRSRNTWPWWTGMDRTGRITRSDKRGHIDKALPPILARLQITADQWRINTTQFEAIHPSRFN